MEPIRLFRMAIANQPINFCPKPCIIVVAFTVYPLVLRKATFSENAVLSVRVRSDQELDEEESRDRPGYFHFWPLDPGVP
jgi:hypothetical protein